MAADLLGELVNEGDVLGLAWGRSTIHMAAALHRLPPCTVVQLTGVYDAGTADRGSVEAVRRAADVSGGEAHPIYAPMLLPDSATAEALRRQTGIARAFEYFDKVTVACVSIGSWEPGVSTVYDMLSEQEREHYASLGAAAEMSAHLFDAEGGGSAGTSRAVHHGRGGPAAPYPGGRRHRRRPAQGRRDRRGAALRAGDEPGHGHRRR